MQFLEASSDVLLKPLNTVIGIVERRTTKPILANILISKAGRRIEFLSSDMDIQIKTHAEIGSGDEHSAITVQARRLHDVLRSLPAAGMVQLAAQNANPSQDSSKMLVSCGGNRFLLQTLPSEQFPLARVPEQWACQITVPQKALLELFSMTSFAMAKQDIRFYLTGVLLVLESGQLRAVATDGHRLAHMAVPLDQPLAFNNPEGQEHSEAKSEEQIILPSKTVIEMQRLLDDSDQPVRISIGQGIIQFEFGDIEFISKLISGRFPDFRRVIPEGYEHHIQINREELQRSLQRAAILVDQDRLRGIKLAFGEGQLKISSNNQEQEEAKIELAIDYSMTPLEIGFNVNYLLDVLAITKSEHILFSVNPDSPNASVLIQIPDKETFKYVVMPLRI